MANTIQTYDLGGDVLHVVEQDASGATVREARGWVSATTNYYPPTSYAADGSRLPGATPRAMTAAEAQAYCQQLLDAAAPAAKPLKLF